MNSPTNYIRDGPAKKENPARINAAPVPRLAQESLSATPHEVAPETLPMNCTEERSSAHRKVVCPKLPQAAPR